MTKDGAEIDLVVERPGKSILFIEIKSATNVEDRHLRTLRTMKEDFGECEAICLSTEPLSKVVNGITVYPWQDGIIKYFHDDN